MKQRLLHILTTLLLLLAAQAGHGQTTLFDYGTSWKYLDNGTNPGTTWNTAAFNDAAWVSDTGWFGYGDTWITKLVNACGTVTQNPSCTNKYITTYFRKVVNIPSTAVYDSVVLNVKRDDGVVIYVNGVEVMRDNMGTGTVINSTTAPLAIGTADEYTAITKKIPVSYFTNGNNTIAVELHQQSGTSSDLGFNMQMIATPSLTIFDYRSAWKYLDNGSDQGTAWSAVGFNDASWVSDTGFFGYGDTWITKLINACGTVVASPSCTNKYITTYFRKVINIANPALYDSVRMYISRDDGFVAYVNGVEVFRDNMPAGAPAYNTSAPVAISGTDEYTPIFKSIPISAFAAGNNTIAIEMHQNGGTSSDVTFTAKMVGVLHVAAPPAVPVTLSQGPYLQMGNQTAVSVRWRTNVASKSKVEVGTVLGTYPIVANDAVARTEHEIRVTGLTANTKYYYRIGTDTSVTQGDLNNFFVTAPVDTSTRRVTIAAFGDCGRNDNSFQTGALTSYQNYLTSQGMKAADLMLLVGDNAYESGTDAEFTTNFFSRYSGNILKNHMLFPAPGNHDYANDGNRQNDHNVPYFSLFSTPTAAECGGVASGTEAYYSYNWGNVHILSLDSYGEENAGTTRLYDTLGAQVQWIKNDLAANNKKWVIAYFHHPPYTMGSHTSDGEPELVNIRQNFIRILERYGVDMVICGHSHDYERSYLLKGHYGNEASFNKVAHTTDTSSAKYDGTTNSCPYTTPSGKVNHGTVYVVSGSAGADGGVQSGYPHNALPFSIDDGGMFYLDIQDNRLDAKFLRRDNTIADKFTIMKDTKVKDTIKIFPGKPLTLNASWQGAYNWNTGATARSISITTPAADSIITVKDSTLRTCLTDQHYLNILCTTPAFTTCPGNISVAGCNNTVTYTVADTGTATPALTYTFTGATTSTGIGSGSGSVFNIGVTNVKVTATNACGSVNCNFTVTVGALPAAVTVSTPGTYCDNTTLVAANGNDGTIYFQGQTSGGTSTATPSASQVITADGTYYFRALSSAGCWGPEGSAFVHINPLPAPVSVGGSGSFCYNTGLTASNGNSGTIYFQGTASAGTSVSVPSATATVTTSGTYYFRAQSAFGCWGQDGYAIVNIWTTPAPISVSGAGVHCGPATVVATGGTGGTIYFQGTTSGGTSTAVAAASQLISSSGTYYFRSRSTAGCWGPEASVTVAINSLPVVHTVTGGGSYCAGDAGDTVGLNGSNAGIVYKLYLGASLAAPAVIGTGGKITFGPQTGAGTYTVVATNLTTSCSVNMTGTATVSINPLPAPQSVTGGGNYCAGGAGLHIGLGSSNTGIRYQLYNGGTMSGSSLTGTGALLDFGAKTDAGTYMVVANDVTTNCTAPMTGTKTINIDVLPNPYTLAGGGSFCAGDTGKHVFVSTSQSAIEYQLYNGVTPVGASVTGTGSLLDMGLQSIAGTYSVKATNPLTTCTNYMTSTAGVSVNPLPSAFSVTGGGAYCADVAGLNVGLSGSNTGISYQLYNNSTMAGLPVIGSGSSLDYGVKSSAGSYTVIATDIITGCTKNMTGAKSIFINPLPADYSVTGGGSYCVSGTGVHVLLSGSDAGINYQLYRSSAMVGTALAGTTSSLDFGSKTSAGAYTVVATNAATNCARTMSSTATISVDPLPSVYSVIGGGSFCSDGAGLNVIIAGTQAGTRYQLYNSGVASGAPVNGTGFSVDFGKHKIGGNYTVIATDTTTSCVSAMADTAVVIAMPISIPSVLVTPDKGNRVCNGAQITYTATPSNGGIDPSYKWMVNGTDITTTANTLVLIPKEGDVITATLTSNAVCATPKTVSSNVTMHVDSVVEPTINVVATPVTNAASGWKVDFRAVVTNEGTAPVYRWFRNKTEIAGSTAATYTASDITVKDSVSCTVTRQDACARSAGDYIVLNSVLSTPQVAQISNITVLPNPNKGEFMVRGTLGSYNDEQMTLEITDMLGQVVYKSSIMAQGGNLNERIQLANVASGMYILNVRSATASKAFHIVIE